MKGLTYFSWHRGLYGFSVNEGEFPNIHISWNRRRGFFFYIAINDRLRWFYI